MNDLKPEQLAGEGGRDGEGRGGVAGDALGGGAAAAAVLLRQGRGRRRRDRSCFGGEGDSSVRPLPGKTKQIVANAHAGVGKPLCFG